MKLKILLSNYSLSWLGGTQTWVATMAEELTRLGHEVHLFSADGQYDLLPDYPRLDDNYDLALINHNVCLSALEGINIKKKVFTSHGIIPELEQPIKGADIYVAVSEEIQHNLEMQGFQSQVIRNPINVKKFVGSPVSPTLSKVMFMSNYQGGARNIIEQACNRIVGLELRVFGKDGQTDAKEAMEWADLVIGLGRTAYEAMSMNRNVIIFDYNGADGFADPVALLDYRRNNCSGRYNRLKLTVDELVEMLGKYNPKLQLRNYILANNDVEEIAQQYLGLIHYK